MDFKVLGSYSMDLSVYLYVESSAKVQTLHPFILFGESFEHRCLSVFVTLISQLHFVTLPGVWIHCIVFGFELQTDFESYAVHADVSPSWKRCWAPWVLPG